MADARVANTESSLYDRDFFQWTQAQAEALRSAGAGGNARLDYENLAEEIESLGKRDRRELGSRIATIIEHLLKLEFSPAEQPRDGWRATVNRERKEVELILRDSPSLRHGLEETLRQAATRAGPGAVDELTRKGENKAAAAVGRLVPWDRYTLEQVMDYWWPEHQGSGAPLAD